MEQYRPTNLLLKGYLKFVYWWASAEKWFPGNCCEDSSRAVMGPFGALRILGFKLKEGTFFTDEPYLADGRWSFARTHWWVERSYSKVDLTLRQFAKQISDPIPDGPLVIPSDSPLGRRYIHTD